MSLKIFQIIQAPQTVNEQVTLLFASLVAILIWAMIIMAALQRKIPSEFKETALTLGGFVSGGIAAQKLSSR
jgi:hypothetical protein